MHYRINSIFWGSLLAMLTVLVLAGIRFYSNTGWKFSFTDFLMVLGLLIIYFTIILNLFLTLELTDASIIRKRNTILFRSKIEIPYAKITRVFRSFWFVRFIYTIEANINGKRIWLHLNLFNKYKEILKTIISKVDASVVDENVLKMEKK